MPEIFHAVDSTPPPGQSSRPIAQCLLGFDYGTRFVGVAIGNTLSADARPLSIIEHRSNEQLFSAIARLLVDWGPDSLVVGVPRYPDGTAHEMTARAERFARQLEGRFRQPVRRVDERYSSVEADGASGSARGMSRNDAVAASVILRQYLNAITRSRDDDRA